MQHSKAKASSGNPLSIQISEKQKRKISRNTRKLKNMLPLKNPKTVIHHTQNDKLAQFTPTHTQAEYPWGQEVGYTFLN